MSFEFDKPKQVDALYDLHNNELYHDRDKFRLAIFKRWVAKVLRKLKRMR